MNLTELRLLLEALWAERANQTLKRNESQYQRMIESGLIAQTSESKKYRVFNLTDKGRELCDRLLETTETFLGE